MTECPPPPAPGSSRLATDFDAALAGIAHFARYPNLMPWVGIGYRDARARVLILGESHYLDTTSTYHLEPERWYEGVVLADKPDRGWINTRGIIRRVGNPLETPL